MFDIGFSELLVIGIVALVVIGPEKLPRVARTLGHLMGRMQRYVADVKADIQREAELDDLRRVRDSVRSTAADIERSVADVAKIDEEINQALAAASAPELPAADTLQSVSDSAATPPSGMAAAARPAEPLSTVLEEPPPGLPTAATRSRAS